MKRSQNIVHLALTLASLGAAACDTGTTPTDQPYVPPAPVQLTPPVGVDWEPGTPPFVRFQADYETIEVRVEGSIYRPIRTIRVDELGRNRLELVTGDDGAAVVIAEPGFHLGAVGATQTDGTIMVCWNTLTGETSDYSPTTPDPARGMALHCRTYHDGELSEPTRIRANTVGCWIRRLVALPDGGFRLLYKGDDGWFEASENPIHGVYESRFASAWSVPTLLIPVSALGDE